MHILYLCIKALKVYSSQYSYKTSIDMHVFSYSLIKVVQQLAKVNSQRLLKHSSRLRRHKLQVVQCQFCQLSQLACTKRTFNIGCSLYRQGLQEPWCTAGTAALATSVTAFFHPREGWTSTTDLMALSEHQTHKRSRCQQMTEQLYPGLAAHGQLPVL